MLFLLWGICNYLCIYFEANKLIVFKKVLCTKIPKHIHLIQGRYIEHSCLAHIVHWLQWLAHLALKNCSCTWWFIINYTHGGASFLTDMFAYVNLFYYYFAIFRAFNKNDGSYTSVATKRINIKVWNFEKAKAYSSEQNNNLRT